MVIVNTRAPGSQSKVPSGGLEKIMGVATADDADDGGGAVPIPNVKDFVSMVERQSVTVKIRVVLPVTAVGVPEITPVELLKERPSGSVPVYDQVYGGTPPLAESAR